MNAPTSRSTWPAGSFVARLPESAFNALFAAGVPKIVASGTPVVVQGDLSRDVYVLMQGRVRVGLVDQFGHAILVEIRSRGDLFGELEAIEAVPRSATVTALGKVTLLVVPWERFTALRRQEWAVEDELLRFTVRRLLAMNSNRTDVHLSVHVRLCRQLVRYSREPYGHPRPDGSVEIERMSQASLAGSIGASVAAVEKAIGALRREGIVATSNRRLTVIDQEALGRVAQLETSLSYPD